VEDAYVHRELEKGSEAFFRDHVIEEETYRMLRNAIDRLPEQTRRVMILALEEHDNKEIAARLQIAEGTVHSLKKIAYKRLREDLKDYFYVCLPLLTAVLGK
jgi:RNA polymerase sigma-70 factor (ECF subfamily)